MHTHQNRKWDSRQMPSPSQHGLQYSQPMKLLLDSTEVQFKPIEMSLGLQCMSGVPNLFQHCFILLGLFVIPTTVQAPKVSTCNSLLVDWKSTQWQIASVNSTMFRIHINSNNTDKDLKNNSMICERYSIQFPRLNIHMYSQTHCNNLVGSPTSRHQPSKPQTKIYPSDDHKQFCFK